MNSPKDTYMLSNGVKIPCIAYGTYRAENGRECVEGIKCAIANGYRHIDTAEFYNNEESVGQGIYESGISRHDIFVTTKVWNTHQGFRTTIDACEGSLQRLGLEYVDLYLVHWPKPLAFREDYPEKFYDTWSAMERLYHDGKVRAIGVCNCLTSHLKDIMRFAQVKPMVLQNEIHVGWMQSEATKMAKEFGMAVEAWAPLVKGRVFGMEPLSSLAYYYGKTEAQILLRYLLQKDIIPLPKSVHEDRIKENIDIFDFELAPGDMAKLDAFEGVGRIGRDPDNLEF